MNWYEMPGALDGLEHNPAYLEKQAIDADVEPIENMKSTSKRSVDRANCSWVKKRRYKKKLVRRFLSINPDMDYSALRGVRCSHALYLCIPFASRLTMMATFMIPS